MRYIEAGDIDRWGRRWCWAGGDAGGEVGVVDTEGLVEGAVLGSGGGQ